jgi:putative FmdB family regulatory protein
MPIYEWWCLTCDRSFEAIVSFRDASCGRRCPRCGESSERIASSFAIRGGSGKSARNGSPHIENRAIAAKVPNFARLCGMDDYSAARMAAYRSGSGAEFDDRSAAQAERKTDK